MVTENLRASPDFELLQPRKHMVALCSCMGDVPAQSKMSNTKGHTGYLACRYCSLTGEYQSSPVRFLGYSESLPSTVRCYSMSNTVQACRCTALHACACVYTACCMYTTKQQVVIHVWSTLTLKSNQLLRLG